VDAELKKLKALQDKYNAIGDTKRLKEAIARRGKMADLKKEEDWQSLSTKFPDIRPFQCSRAIKDEELWLKLVPDLKQIDRLPTTLSGPGPGGKKIPKKKPEDRSPRGEKRRHDDRHDDRHGKRHGDDRRGSPRDDPWGDRSRDSRGGDPRGGGGRDPRGRDPRDPRGGGGDPRRAEMPGFSINATRQGPAARTDAGYHRGNQGGGGAIDLSQERDDPWGDRRQGPPPGKGFTRDDPGGKGKGKGGGWGDAPRDGPRGDDRSYSRGVPDERAPPRREPSPAAKVRRAPYHECHKKNSGQPCALPRVPQEKLGPTLRPTTSATGLARTARLGPVFGLRIPISGPHSARNSGRPTLCDSCPLRLRLRRPAAAADNCL
jgi:hypothetical protein